jgi:hypothetical protein
LQQMQLRLMWNRLTAAGAALLVNAYQPPKSASVGACAPAGGGAGESAVYADPLTNSGKRSSSKKPSVRGKCFLGYNLVNVDLLASLLCGGSSCGGAAAALPLDVEFGGGGGGGGGGGNEKHVAF